MAGRAGYPGVGKSAVKPAEKNGAAAGNVAASSTNVRPKVNKKVIRKASTTTSQKKQSQDKLVQALKIRLAELERQKEESRGREQKYRQLADYYEQLNDISTSFVKSSDIKDLYKRIAEGFRRLTGSIAATFSVYHQEAHTLQAVSLSADPPYQQKIDTFFGPELFKMQMPVSPDMREQMHSQLIRRPKDLVELSMGTISRDISDIVMEAIGCDQIVALAICYGAEIQGSCVAYLPANTPVVPDNALKTFLHMAALAVKRKRTEEALKENESLYRLLANNMVDGIWLLDMDLKLTYCSPSSAKQSGFTLQEITEMSLEQYFTPESLKIVSDAFLEEMPRVQADPNYNPLLTLDLEYYKKDGTAFWAESKFSVIRDERGKPESILGVARDITERRLAEKAHRESEEKYRNLFDNASEAIYVAQEGNLVFLNPQTSRMIGYSAEEIIQRQFVDFIHVDDRKLVIDRHIRRLKGEVLPDRYEFRIIHKNGDTRWVELNTVVITWAAKPATLNFLVDITDRKMTEEKLVESYQSVKKTLNDAINTIGKIVELRDPYTSGHQQKVADLATAIAREIKLDDSRIDQIRTAALIHDIGKMYVPSDILSKPGRLSDIEFNLIKTHSRSGYAIVKGMDFPCSVADAILQHHERLDGSGYPAGIEDHEIILEAKILAVADVVEAMASHRPYRAAPGISRALEEISENKGRLYDSDVVNACLELFRNNKFEFKSI